MNRYIRLDTMWDASAWLQPLSAEAQLVWLKLLCYAKNAGRDGRVKALIPAVAARMWFVGEESVRQLLIAAENHGAVTIDGSDWVISKWMQYQGDATAAERKRKQREREKEEMSQTSRVTPVTSREKEKEKENKNTIKQRERASNPDPPISPHGGAGVETSGPGREAKPPVRKSMTPDEAKEFTR